MLELGTDLLGSAWDDYKKVINDAHATFSQKEITWQRFNVEINRFQEDNENTPEIVYLKVLLNYNVRRTWPINVESDSGMDDEQCIQILINKEYLRINNLLDSYGNFNYNELTDNFIIDGTLYKTFGDTPVSQMRDDDLFITIIVKRVRLETGTKR